MTMKRTEMRVIRCSDPEQNPAAGKPVGNGWRETDLRSAEREAPAEAGEYAACSLCFCSTAVRVERGRE